MKIIFKQNPHLLPTNKAILESLMLFQEMPYEKEIKRLLSASESSTLDQKYLLSWLQTDDPKEALSTFEDMRSLGLIKGSDSPSALLDSATDVALNECIGELTDEACMLANDQGFHLANVGFEKELADELAALAAELHSFHVKRVQRLVEKGLAGSNTWTIPGQDAPSSLTFRPLHTDHQSFILINKGIAKFNNKGLLNLARLLMNKYNL